MVVKIPWTGQEFSGEATCELVSDPATFVAA
jgi:hypothetical protein